MATAVFPDVEAILAAGHERHAPRISDPSENCAISPAMA